jgi:hypothetical protein
MVHFGSYVAEMMKEGSGRLKTFKDLKYTPE